MLIYYIDAFNLIHKVNSLVESVSPHSALLQFMVKKRLTGSLTNRVVIVFDGYLPAGQNLESAYEIVFSNFRTADEVIKERISNAKNKRQIVVVSDDNSIRNFARAEGASVVAINDFLKRRLRKEKEDTEDDGKNISESSNEQLLKELSDKWGR